MSAPGHEAEAAGWLRVVAEAGPAALVVVDAARVIQLVSRGAEQLFGYGRAELMGQPVEALLPAGTLDHLAVQSPRELFASRKDGAEIPIEVTLTPIDAQAGRLAMLSIADLAEHAGQYQGLPDLIVEDSPTAIVVTSQQRTIVLVNRKTEELFGYARAELLGQPTDLLIPRQFHKAHAGHVDRYLAAPTKRPMGIGRELFGRRKDGSEISIEIGLHPLRTPEGPFTLASIIDITQRKAIEDELRRSNAELEQFAYIASHDLQEPLRMVASYTELLAQRYRGKLDDKADKYIFYAVDGAKRMQRLVADLLAYSRVGSQGRPLVPVDAHAVVTSVVEMMKPTIRKANAKIEVSPLPAVLADEGQLRQLFQNLIGNALKFRAEADPVIGIRAARYNDRWMFCVEDNGIGIDMQYAERVFHMFQRLHERGKYDGSGIGLSIVKRIVERHGGTIWLESKPGIGTSFFFSLIPIDKAPP